MTYKVFESGETLTANDVQTYFMDQVVIQVPTEAELDTLIADHPDVRVAYAEDTDKVYVYQNSAWEALALEGGNLSVADLTVSGNLTVTGTTTTVDSTTIQVKDSFVFEGATSDAYETTLQVTDPTADRTITLPDSTGTVALTSDIPTLNGLLPSQTGNSGKYLTTDGTDSSWGTVDLSGKTDKSTLTTTGDIYYASSASTPARLGIGSQGEVLTVSSGVPAWSAPAAGGFVGCRLYLSSGNQVSNFSASVINWSAESFDTDNFHSLVTNPSRITIPSGKGGKYRIDSQMLFTADDGDLTDAYIYKNGSVVAVRRAKTGGNGFYTAVISSVMDLAAGDYIEIYIYQEYNTGSTQNVEPTLGGTECSNVTVEYLGA